jgi:hypothetical protein
MRNLILLLFAIATLNSCKKAANSKPVTPSKPHKVLILGNSIIYSPPNPDILWFSNWGMAASAPEKDFVHLLTARLKSANDSTAVTIKNIGEFEFYFDSYDIEANLKKYRDAKPDILIIKIGESVTRNSDAALFEQRYIDLLNYFKSNNPNIKILAAGSIYVHAELPNRVMSKYSPYVSLSYLEFDRENFAYRSPSVAIQAHPSDKGMQSITDSVWGALKEMIY